MATREEVMGAAERHIRRGELDVAVGLLERWTAVFPDDASAVSRSLAVRALADEERPAKAASRGAREPEAPSRARLERALDPSPIERLTALLAQIQVNRRDR